MAAHHLIAADLPGITGGQRGFVFVIAALAILALVYAIVLVKEVLAADQGTPKMQEISKAVQEGASAYLNRQFRTLGVFAIIVFILLLLLPVNDGGWPVRIGRAIFFLVGACFSATVGYVGMTMATRSNVRVAAAAQGGTSQRGFHIACEDLQPARRFVVNGGQDRYPLAPEVEAISVLGLATELAAL